MRDLLGHESLRPGQRAAIDAVLAGHDVVAIMPTGSGKSAVYQVCGAVIDGVTVVVSPLLALQRDQLASIDDDQVGRGVRLDSTMGRTERGEVLDDVAAGDAEFVFVSPEQLLNDETFEAIAAVAPSLVVVDEAHCVSTWGHDFRPAYAELGAVLDRLGRPQVLCLTATAAPPVRDDIVEVLGLGDPVVVVTGFDRPNLHLSVRRFVDAADRDAAVVAAASELRGAGIVYVATRRRAVGFAEAIRGARRVAHYHGGMRSPDRDAAQQEFVGGDAEVMVATNAFGMGIDKPDVRWVLHADLPDSLDSYSQEVGRAGRDGEPARVVLFHHPSDVGRQRFLTGVAAEDPRAALVASRLEMIRSYAETERCRRAQILSALGEPFEPPCHGCDVCDRVATTGAVPDRRAPAADDLEAGCAVEHRTWGRGSVLAADADRLTVLFDEHGYRHLDRAVVVEDDLLRRVDP